MAKRIRKNDRIVEFLQLTTGISQKKGKKAAPRFELGIKDLQSSALPLGHAAEKVSSPSSMDRISEGVNSLLVISNGHGEDEIAMRVLEALHELYPRLLLEVLPLVGGGNAFESAVSAGWLKRLGPSAYLPSGGFSNQSLVPLIKDLFAGLISLSWEQLRVVLKSAHHNKGVLAVGDLLPLILAWMSRSKYVFIGTPKSDYTWRSGPGKALSDYYHMLKGSEWDPWEWFLMRSNRCQMVAVRDKLTAKGLRRHGVLAQAPGNPMMDGFIEEPLSIDWGPYRRVLLLCGSRIPEAVENFTRLLRAVNRLDHVEPCAVLVALGSEPSVKYLEVVLSEHGYFEIPSPVGGIGVSTCWSNGTKIFCLGPGQFKPWVRLAEVGLATAGTATEQLVGLGIPALSIPGHGPQFTFAFALRQSRLLGGAVQLCRTPKAMGNRLQLLLADEALRRRFGNVGVQRMGPAGGSRVLAKLIAKSFFGE